MRSGKRRKLDPLTNRGEGGEGEDDGDIREWLLDTTDMIKETGAEMARLDIQKPSRRMKQLELSFVAGVNVIVVSEQLEDAQDVVVDVEGQEEKHDGVEDRQKSNPDPTGESKAPTLKRKKTLKRLARENRKMTDWFLPGSTPKEPEEVTRMDAPELEDSVTLERLEEARVKKMKWRTRFEVNTIVNELARAYPRLYTLALLPLDLPRAA
jgi:hypothetical protein